MEKTVNVLLKEMKKHGGTDIHFTAENIHETQNLTAVVSVYENIKPAHMVLNELIKWAKLNDEKLAEKIDSLQSDMSWNPNLDSFNNKTYYH